jgi:sugar phosphate isomerase/epimerase
MELGIFAKTFPDIGAAESLEAVRQAGFTTAQFNLACVGLPTMPDRINEDIVARIRAASLASGVSIAAISGTYNMAHPDAAVRQKGMARLRVLIESAHAMRTRMVTLCTGSRDPYDQWNFHADNTTPEAWRDLLGEMELAVTLAEQHDVDLGVEPELANVVASAEDAVRLIETLRSERIKIVVDPANLFERGPSGERRETIERAVAMLAGRITMAHAKDRAEDGRFVAAGTGVIDFRHFVATLKSNGFKGPLVTHGLAADEAPAVAAFLRGVLGEQGLLGQDND